MSKKIIEETRTIEGFDYRVSLGYASERKKFSVGATPIDNRITPGFEIMTMSDMIDVPNVYLPIEVTRFSKKAEAQAREIFEENLRPLLQKCIALRLKKFKSEDFNQEGDSDWKRSLKQPFVAYSNLITRPETFAVNNPNVPVTGWVDGKIDNRPAELFLKLTWNDETDIPWDWDRYVYLIMTTD